MPVCTPPIDPVARLKAFYLAHRTQRKAAAALGVSVQFLRDMLDGKRQVSARVLDQLGLKRTTTVTIEER